jgi:hypothetical protein
VSEFKGFAAGSSEAQVLQTLSYLFKQQVGGAPGFAVAGVVAGLGVSQTATASGSVVVGSGMGVLQSTVTSGMAPLVSNADKTVDVLGASPMGSLPRIDVIVFKQSTASIEVIVGTPNASPVANPAAAFELQLAQINHAANATTVPTSAITDLRVFTTLNVPDAAQWQSITPVYTNTLGESLSVGNGTISGRVRISGTGAKQMLTFQGSLVRGSTTNVGTGGSWAIQLPTPAVDNSAIGVGSQTIGSAEKQLLVTLPGSTLLAFCDAAGARISPSNPGGAASAQAGHVYKWNITYPIA